MKYIAMFLLCMVLAAPCFAASCQDMQDAVGSAIQERNGRVSDTHDILMPDPETERDEMCIRDSGYSTGVKIVFRTIPSMPPVLEDLNVEQGILDHAMPSNGLVLVTGVMGSGKSTLLAAILRRIIETGGRNVSTYEAPIEFDFDAVPNPGGPVSQSTIPEHLKSFLTATRNSTRTAPDVVLIGESRDPDTLRGMMESAEIGVAAYSTVHTLSLIHI